MIIAGADIETTGLEIEKGHKIIEVAFSLYRFDDKGVKHIGNYEQRIHPMRTIAADAERLHGISLNDLAGKPVFREVAPKIAAILQRCDLVVMHNGEGFDGPFLAYEISEAGVDVPSIELFDTMKNARWATPNGKFPNLGELCFSLNVDYDSSQAHGALYDVQVMMEAYFEAVRRGVWSPQLENQE